VKEIAGYIVAPMWREFMLAALEKVPKEFFAERRPIPDDAPFALRGGFSDGQSFHDILHWVNKDDPMGRGTSRGDQQYPYWEFALHADLSQLQPATTGTSTPEEQDEDEEEDDDS